MDRADHGWRDMCVVAVRSARARTSLRPHLLYDGAEDDFTREMRSLGVTVIFARSPMYDDFVRHAAATGNPRYVDVASGAFLRWSIPTVETTEDHVLYTDVDVMFREDPVPLLRSLIPFRTAFLGAGEIIREKDGGYLSNFNSGVMLLNLKAFRAELPALMAATVEDLGFGLDQEWLIRFFAQRWGRLPENLNFKPYWKLDTKDARKLPVIIHFHGPKPAAIHAMMQGGGGHGDVWRSLFEDNKVRYASVLREFEGYLGRPAGADISPVKFVIDAVDVAGSRLKGWVLNHRAGQPEPRVMIFHGERPCGLVQPDAHRPDLVAAGYRDEKAGFDAPLHGVSLRSGILTARNAHDGAVVAIEHAGWTGTRLDLSDLA